MGFCVADRPMRSSLPHSASSRIRDNLRRRVAGAHPGPDVDVGQSLPAQVVADAGERLRKVLLDVVAERLERGDVDDLGLVPELARNALAHQVVDHRQEGGERLARAGRRRDQRVPARLDRWPGVGLRRRRADEAALEPVGDGRVKKGPQIHGRETVLNVVLKAPKSTQGSPRSSTRRGLLTL